MPSLTEACAAAVREANFRGKLLSVTQLQHEDLLLSSLIVVAQVLKIWRWQCFMSSTRVYLCNKKMESSRETKVKQSLSDPTPPIKEVQLVETARQLH